MTKRKRSGSPKRRRSSGDPRRRAPEPARSEGDEGAAGLVDGLRAALAEGHPLSMLAQASSMLHVTDPRRQHPLENDAEPDAAGVPPRDELLEMFADSGQPETQALAWAMAHLQPDELLRAKVVRRIDRRQLPPWLAELGRAEVYGARETDEPLHDSTDIVLGVRVAEHQLAVVGLVDFNAGGALKDGFAVPASLAEFEDIWRRSDYSAATNLHTLGAADARARLEAAIEHGALMWPPFESDSWPQARPFLEWAIRLCPPGGTDFLRPEPTEKEQDRLIKDFVRSPYGAPFNNDDGRSLLESVIWFGAGYTWGDPLLLSPTKIEILMLDWVPRKIMADAVFLARLPDLLQAFVAYGHDRRSIPRSDTEETLAQVAALTPEYLALIASPRRQGAEALLERMGVLEPISDEEYFLGGLARQVGGLEEFNQLDDDPLPDEDLALDDLPDDIVARVTEVGRLCDECCAALFDVAESSGPEYRTAVRRLIHDVAVGDPMIFRRRSKNETTAAALCWLVARANEQLGWHGGVQTQELMAHFGLTGSPSQRAEPMRRAAKLPTEYYRTDLGSQRYLTSAMRRTLIERRDRWLAYAAERDALDADRP